MFNVWTFRRDGFSLLGRDGVAGMYGVVLVLRNCGSGERFLRLWISGFNEQGIAGLIDQPLCGRPRKLTSASATAPSA